MKSKRMNGNERFIPNSFQTPNAYVDDLMYLLTSSEWKVLSYTVRRIFGFQKRADRISISQYIEGTLDRDAEKYYDHGTGLSKHTVIKALDDLVKFGIMRVVSENNPKTNNGREYSLTTDPSTIDFFALNSRALEVAKSNAKKAAIARSGEEDDERCSDCTEVGAAVTPHPVQLLDTQYTVEIQGKPYSDSEKKPLSGRDETEYVIEVQMPPDLSKPKERLYRTPCPECRKVELSIDILRCPECDLEVRWSGSKVLDDRARKARADAKAAEKKESSLRYLLPGARYLQEQAQAREDAALGRKPGTSKAALQPSEIKALADYERKYGEQYVRGIVDGLEGQGRGLMAHVVNKLSFATKGQTNGTTQFQPDPYPDDII